MDLGISARLRPILDEVKRFIDNEILPLEHEFLAEVDKGDRWSFTPRQTEILETLKSKARERGLWNFFLTGHEDGHGLNTVEYAYSAEETGKAIRPGGAFLVYQFRARVRDFMEPHFKRIDNGYEFWNVLPCYLFWGWKS